MPMHMSKMTEKTKAEKKSEFSVLSAESVLN